ncbi:MAG: aminomethyl-transferring glycine dehydrogenase subunit GcvPA, partial [Candidatus Cloacimonetes bacterium]|nr:aminomethyl-transferring glycine dehydrogenase subunit GcvPA [Candidatus Cloacimonadota bacterium]
PYISNTDRDRREMFAKIGVQSFDELIQAIPEKFRLKGALKMDKAFSEMEITNKIKSQTCNNLCTQSANSFLGAGVYDHFIPAAVDSIVSRPEFFTAYTPYQAEVSQGTLQFIYEYQTMICELTGMEIANASMYDGASAVAEAILMAVRKNKLLKALLPATLNPEYVKVVKAYTEGTGVELVTIPAKDGLTDLAALKQMLDGSVGSVVLQSPNFNGNIEDAKSISEAVHTNEKCLLIAAVDPISLAILNSPSEYDADIVVGEGQALGNSMYMGGPLFGFFATKLEMNRQMPGRIVGGTVDKEGKRAYALTLQAREQHIRRAKATSNICSNQSLCTLAATVYLSLMGREGLREVAIQSTQKAHYLAEELCKIQGIDLKYAAAPFFKEFVITTPIAAAEINERMLPRGIYAGVEVGKNELMLAVTEKKTKAQIDDFIKAMQEVCHA